MSDMPIGFCVDPADNVATLLSDAQPGDARLVGVPGRERVAITEAVRRGHKIALTPIAEGMAVIKYNVPIGYARTDIAAGNWVHLHNCQSRVDERSSSLDPQTGAPTDVHYE